MSYKGHWIYYYLARGHGNIYHYLAKSYEHKSYHSCIMDIYHYITKCHENKSLQGHGN